MGAASSKAARSAVSASTRKYPSRTPGSNPTTNASSQPPPPGGQPTEPGPTVRPQAQASGSRDEAINLDASDPDFARSLRTLGPVQPSSMLSNSSTFSPGAASTISSSSDAQDQNNAFPNHSLNPALTLLSRRAQLAQEAEAELSRVRYGGGGSGVGGLGGDVGGRKFLDVVKIREVLVMRDEREMSEEEIERRLGLQKGLVARLGGRGVVREAGLGDVRGAGDI